MFWKAKKILIFLFLISFFLLAPFTFTGSPQISFAVRTVDNASGLLSETVAPTGISQSNVIEVIGVVIKALLTLVGMGFLVLMVYAGFTWMTARGEEAKTEKAKKTIIAAVTGLAVTVASYGIVAVLFGRLVG